MLNVELKEKLLRFVRERQKPSSNSQAAVLIVGDAGLDEYFLGDVKRISPEAPVPVLEVTERTHRIGLAGNVAQNVSSLGLQSYFVGMVGADSAGEDLKNLFRKANVALDGLVVDDSRPTIRKARAMAGPHQLLRLDFELKRYIDSRQEDLIFEKSRTLLPKVSAVIVEDYAKGLLTPTLLTKLLAECRKQNKPVYVDPARSNPAEFYRHCNLFKPNWDEALQIAGIPREEFKEDPNLILKVAQKLKAMTQAEQIVITQGKKGMAVLSESGVTQVPTFARQVFDVTGAGDTVIAAITVGLVGGLNLFEACMLANLAAGFVVGQVGSVSCSLSDLQSYIESTPTFA